MSGTAFFHLHRDAKGIERTGREQLLLHVGEKLRVHVVEIGFEDCDGVGVLRPTFAPMRLAQMWATRRRSADSPISEADDVGGAGEVAGSGTVAGGGERHAGEAARKRTSRARRMAAPVGVSSSLGMPEE